MTVVKTPALGPTTLDINWEKFANFLLAGWEKFRDEKNERIAALELQVKQLQGSLEALEAQVRQSTPKSKGEVLGAAMKFDPLPGSYGR